MGRGCEVSQCAFSVPSLMRNAIVGASKLQNYETTHIPITAPMCFLDENWHNLEVEFWPKMLHRPQSILYTSLYSQDT